ncbi:short chain dehydrogenase [Annulohypoxylon bovei var. microspora]|nr:short chain dehydrogenase [Annulohypoxylon bovei var. microspora]
MSSPLGSRNPFSSLVAQLSPLEYPIADCTGRTAIVTGASSGLGLETARHFVRLKSEKVILGCRDLSKGEVAKKDIESSEGRLGVVEVWELDLGSFDSVKSFCHRAEELDRLDIVVENAGLSSKNYEVLEGYERQVTVNVISTFLMGLMLLPKLRKSAAENSHHHLVFVASNAHLYPTFEERNASSIFDALKGDTQMQWRYPTTKLLVVLIARELARQLSLSGGRDVIINFLDTGLCKTNLFREEVFPMSWALAIAMFLVGRTCEMGSRVILWAALAGPETHGKYIEDCHVSFESQFVRSEEGMVSQVKAYKELLAILESIHPGITKNV